MLLPGRRIDGGTQVASKEDGEALLQRYSEMVTSYTLYACWKNSSGTMNIYLIQKVKATSSFSLGASVSRSVRHCREHATLEHERPQSTAAITRVSRLTPETLQAFEYM